MGRKILAAVFTAIYSVAFFLIIKYIFGQMPVNFLCDILSIVSLIIVLVISIVLADKTVDLILKHL